MNLYWTKRDTDKLDKEPPFPGTGHDKFRDITLIPHGLPMHQFELASVGAAYIEPSALTILGYKGPLPAKKRSETDWQVCTEISKFVAGLDVDQLLKLKYHPYGGNVITVGELLEEKKKDVLKKYVANKDGTRFCGHCYVVARVGGSRIVWLHWKQG
jgi:hypothetical protein